MKISPSVRGAFRFDGEDSTYFYVGDAPEGTSDSSPVWRIYRLTNSGTNSLIKEWADGNSQYDNVWADRTTLNYA